MCTDLQGTIPSQLGLLTTLVHLTISRNSKLSGVLPSELGLLTKLTNLDVSSLAKLSGAIPSKLGSLAKLKKLITYDSKVTNPVPKWDGGAAPICGAESKLGTNIRV